MSNGQTEHYMLYNTRGDQLMEEMAFWLEYLDNGDPKVRTRLRELLDAMRVTDDEWLYMYDALRFIHAKIPMDYVDATKD